MTITVHDQLSGRYPANKSDTQHEWEPIAEACRSEPLKWIAISGRFNRGHSSHIRHGRIKAFEPAGAFEATARDHDDDRNPHSLWIRYVGPTE